MGTSHLRSVDAPMRAPLRNALTIGINRLDVLVHQGATNYADILVHEADEPGRDPLTSEILGAIAGIVRKYKGAYF